MDRPLWRILLPVLILVVAVHRGVLAVVMGLGDAPGVLVAAHVVEAALAVAAALGLWLGHTWVTGAILGLGVAIGATALLEAFYVGVRPPAAAVAQLVVAAFAAGALAVLIRRELVAPAVRGDADDPAHAERTRPEHRYPKRREV